MGRKKKNSKVIGITGGIGSGQSTVAKILQKKGACIIDADQRGRDVYTLFPEVSGQIRELFGLDAFTPNGEIDRNRLGKIVFSSQHHLERLNHLIHPRMVELIIADLEEARYSGKYPVVAVDAALIFEIQMESLFSNIVCVYAPLELRIDRVKKRNGLSEKEILGRMESQIVLDDKRDWSDFVIPNDGTIENLKERTEIFWEILTRKRF